MRDFARPGMFVSFEGGEGTGKSTQILRLAERLSRAGVDPVVTREPGGSEGAERIRALLLAGGEKRLDSLAETLLFFAARADHIARLVAPERARGAWVLCDRFSDSTRVYQGYLGQVPFETLDRLELIVVGDHRPDLTLLLDLPAALGLDRARQRRGAAPSDGFEAETLDFHERIREAFLDLSRRESDRIVVIDASGDEDAIAERIWQAVLSRSAAHGFDRA